MTRPLRITGATILFLAALLCKTTWLTFAWALLGSTLWVIGVLA